MPNTDQNRETTQQPADGASSPHSTSSTDFKSFKLSQNFAAVAGVKKHVTTIQVRKPGKQEFIRVHPEYALETALLDLKEEGEVYLVDPSLWDELALELTPKVLYPTINRQGVLRIWPIRLPDEEGKLDDWNRSALEAAELAKTDWTRVSSNRSAGMYDAYVANGDLPEPDWPEMSFEDMLETAFGANGIIGSLDHPVLRKLRGES